MAKFYFVDTREDAKNKEPFAMENADVAKVWTREYHAGEGPFKPVEEPLSDKGTGVVTEDAEFAPNFQVNRRDLQEAGVNQTQVQEEATAHNLKVLAVSEDNPYKGMTKAELQDELDARGLEYKKSGPESTNDSLIALLVEDDKE